MLISNTVLENACNWILENAGPSIKYRTLTEIMGFSPYDDKVDKIYTELLHSKRLKRISSFQNDDGSFGQKSFHHGTDSSETFLRNLQELGLRSDYKILQNGIDYAEKLYKSGEKDIGWIPGIYLEPIGRSRPSKLVEDWFENYLIIFNEFLKSNRHNWLTTAKGKPATSHLEIPYIYVLRTISNSWWWLKKRKSYNIAPILEFLLIDMAKVKNLYWIAPNKQLFSYPNFLHVLGPGVITSNVPSTLDLLCMLEGLWLLSIFGIIEEYSGLKEAFDFVSSNRNNDGVWEFPISGMTKAKAEWHSYHGLTLEESWKCKESHIAELTFRICLIASRNNPTHSL